MHTNTDDYLKRITSFPIMTVEFDCLSNQYRDSFEFIQCLKSINQGFINSQYVDVDDICRFLRLAKGRLYEYFERLNNNDDSLTISSILEVVFEIMLGIHERTKDKEDLLQEFNKIHEILEEYDPSYGLKMKLNILRQINDQCKIYDNRPVDQLQERKKRHEDRISREDYNFLSER